MKKISDETVSQEIYENADPAQLPENAFRE